MTPDANGLERHLGQYLPPPLAAFIMQMANSTLDLPEKIAAAEQRNQSPIPSDDVHAAVWLARAEEICAEFRKRIDIVMSVDELLEAFALYSFITPEVHAIIRGIRVAASDA